MPPSLTDTLCTRCALCCDGSLFADVELAGRAEATALEALGLPLDEDDAAGALLVQPCAALKGTRCGIYAHRPRCCRAFECRLLKDVRRGALSVGRAEQIIAGTRKRIRRVESLLARLGPSDASLPLEERCAEALARRSVSTAGAGRIRAELKAALASVRRTIRGSFLGGGSRRDGPGRG